jgi:hypothetical protein
MYVCIYIHICEMNGCYVKFGTQPVIKDYVSQFSSCDLLSVVLCTAGMQLVDVTAAFWLRVSTSVVEDWWFSRQ